jgi:ABC-type transport system substrate-binding protein
MAYKIKLNKINHISSKKGFLKRPFFHGVVFLKRLVKSIGMMSKAERTMALFTLIASLIMLSVLGLQYYREKTVPAPASGGTYREGIFGEIKYINPVLASNDNDRSVSGLIFSGLVRFNEKNEVIPDVADRWEVSSDQKSYKFILKDSVFFQDSEKLTSGDIVYTIGRIKELENKSPLYDAWKDVSVSAPDETTVVFDLPKPYGPFLFNCNFGILPDHISPEEISKKPIGSGKYKFNKIKKDNGTIKSVALDRNENYYSAKPYIRKIDLEVFDSEKEMDSAVQKNKIDAVSGSINAEGFHSISFSNSRKLGLILNVKDAKLSDKSLRQKILSQEDLSEKVDLTLDTIDSEPQRSKANELKNEFASKNIQIEVRLHKPVEMVDVLQEKKYQLLLYGFDFGIDRDPYIFWHSTQIGNQNFTNWSSKETDILLEDARMINDSAQRNSKYDEFYRAIETEYLIVFFDISDQYFTISDKIKGLEEKFGNEAASRYSNIEKWYIKETRIKK